MTRRHYAFIAAGLVFFALAALQGIVRPGAATRSQTRTLEDGHTLTLREYQYGANLSFGSPLERAADRFLPERLRRSLGLKSPWKLNNSDPALGLWFHYSGPPNQFGSQAQCSIADESGFFVQRTGSVSIRGADDGTGTSITLSFPALPRRSRTLRIKIGRRDAKWRWEELADYEIPNPAFGSGFPVWPAESLPASRAINDLEITLERLAFGTGSNRKFEAPKTGSDPVNGLAAFVVKQGGAVTTDWKPDGVEMADATGNEAGQGSWGGTWRGTTNFFQWSPTLWPDTGGMRFRFEFTRETKASFATNEIIEIKGIAVPASTNVTELNLVTNRLGHQIRIVGLAGKNGRFTGYDRIGGGNDLSLEVEVTPPLLDKQIDTIAAQDEAGDPVQHGGGSWSRTSGRYGFRINPGPDAKTVDITLAVHASVYAEFTVAPEVFLPAE